MLRPRDALIALLLTMSLPAPALAGPPHGARSLPAHGNKGVDALLGAAPFALSPAELLALRGPKAPTGIDIEVLLDDTTYTLDAQGKRNVEYHMVYRVLSEAGMRGWGSLGTSYHPWFQERPVLKARIVTPDGSAHLLDDKTLVDALVPRDDANTFSDTRNLSAPLPAVRVGSVVETSIVVREHKPYFAAGTLTRHAVWAQTYTALSRISVSAPEGARLSHAVRGTSTRAQVEQRAGQQKVTLLERDVLPMREWPSATDPDQAFLPTLEFTTAKSWNDVARSYAQAVDEQIATFDAHGLARDILGGESDPGSKLAKLLAFLHREVRYTGLELGERSLIPSSPKDTLTRRYGDCKDKATLLVGLLRASGFDAHVALLSTGPGLDVPQRLAGLGLFDHAIVRVGGKQPLWIDATAEHAGPADLPYADQDRLALVASSQTRGLERTPRTRSTESSSVEDVHVELAELGNAAVREVTTGQGPLAAELRSMFDKSDEQLKEQFKSYVKERYGATVSSAHAEAAHDPTRPFELTIRSQAAEHFETYDDGGFVQLTPNGLYAQLPATLYDTPLDKRSKEEEEAAAPDARFQEAPKLPVYVGRAHTLHVGYHLSLADGFRWHTLPDPMEMEAEGIHLARKVRKESDQRAVVEFELRTDARLVPVKELEKVRTVLHDFTEQAGASVRFVHVAREAIERGDVATALATHRELLKRHPKSVPVKSRYAQDLLRAGLGVAARRSAEQLAKEHPDSARAHWTHGFVWLFDEVGRDSYPGSDYQRGEKAMRTALARDPEEELYYQSLATVLTQLALEKRPTDLKRLEEAASLYEKLRSKFKNHANDLDLLRNYVWRDKHREAAQLAEELEASADRNMLWVVSTMSREGPAAAQRKAEQLSGGDPRDLLARAAGTLGVMGRYEAGMQLMRLPVLRESRAALTARPLEAAAGRAECEAKLPAAARAVIDWQLGFYREPSRLRNARAELEKLPEASIDADSLATELESGSRRMPPARAAAALTLPMVGDTLPCLFRWEAEEKSGAVRVKAFVPGAGGGTDPSVFYLRKNPKGYQLIAARQKGRTVGIARAMFAALEAKQLEEARVWAEWAYPEIEPYGGHKERYGFADGARALWPKDLKTASADDLGLLAAFLSGGYGVKGRELKLLDAALKRSANAPDRLRAINLARAWNLQREQNYAAAQSLYGALHREFPEDEGLWQRYMHTLYWAHADAELARELDTYDAKKPDNDYTSGMRNSLDRRAGRFAEVLARTQSRLDANKAARGELNNVAWAALFAGGDLAKATALGEAACNPESDARASDLHTLATLYAETGNVSKAQLKLVASMDKRGGTDIAQHEWYTWGRIAEQLGLLDVARDAYERVEKPELPSESDSYLLAQRRLKQLGR